MENRQIRNILKLSIVIVGFSLIGCQSGMIDNNAARNFWSKDVDSLEFSNGNYWRLGSKPVGFQNEMQLYPLSYSFFGEDSECFVGAKGQQVYWLSEQTDPPNLWFDFSLGCGDTVWNFHDRSFCLIDAVIGSTYFFRTQRIISSHDRKPVQLWAIDSVTGFQGFAVLQDDSCGMKSIEESIFPEKFTYVSQKSFAARLGGYVGATNWENGMRYMFNRQTNQITVYDPKLDQRRVLDIDSLVPKGGYLSSCLFVEKDSLVIQFDSLRLTSDLNLEAFHSRKAPSIRH